MKLTYEDYDQLSVVTLKGDLTLDECDAFEEAVKQRMESEIRDFVFNLAETDTVDSRGLEAFLWVQAACAERLGQVRLAAASPTLREVLRVTRLAGRFDCHESIDQAVASLR